MFFKKFFYYTIHPIQCLKRMKYKRLHSSYGKKMDDEKYIKEIFKLSMGYKLDLNNPKTFNEKLQWLKLYNRKTEFVSMVDKSLSKEIVAKTVGEEYVAKTYGIWEHFDDINFDVLPEKFVLKTTHDCGGVIICKDKNKFDNEASKKFLEKHLTYQYFYHCREWPYKNVKPRIMAEEFLQDGNREVLPVYKIMCFGGQPKIIQTIQNDKQPNETIDYFDTEWNLLDLRQNFPNSEVPLNKPEKLEEMLSIARKLSEGMSFIRVDLYTANEKIYFSEFTFFSDAGLASFDPPEWDLKFGEWIRLDALKIHDK